MSQDQFYIRFRGEVGGPFTREQLQARLKSGQLTTVHSIRQGQAGDWVGAKTLDWLYPTRRIVHEGTDRPERPAVNEPTVAGMGVEDSDDRPRSSVGSAKPRKAKLYNVVLGALLVLLLLAVGGAAWLLIHGNNSTLGRSSTVNSLRDGVALTETLGFVVSGAELVAYDGQAFQCPTATGSAFAISHDGLMLTNRHVVEDHIRLSRAKALKDDLARTAKIQVEERLWVFVNGEKMRGEVVFASDQFDAAVIRVPCNFARVFKISASNRVPLDEEVRAAGFPQAGDVRVSLSDAEAVQKALKQRQLHADARNYFGPRDLDFVLTSGRVSRSTRDDANGTYWIQHNADVNPGNSGGPLITADGTVVAINTIAIDAASGMYFSLATGQLRDELMKLKGDITWTE